MKAKEAVATDPNMFPATVNDPDTTTLPETATDPVKAEVPTTLKDPELTKDPVNSIRSPLNSKVSLATDRLPVRFIDPETPKDPVSSIRSPLNSKVSLATESTFPELPEVACKDKDPLNTTDPEFCAPVVIADCIVSDPDPDFLKKTLPSGTFIPISPANSDAVVGSTPATRLLF